MRAAYTHRRLFGVVFGGAGWSTAVEVILCPLQIEAKLIAIAVFYAAPHHVRTVFVMICWVYVASDANVYK